MKKFLIPFLLLSMTLFSGCSKDQVLDTYNSVLQAAGSVQLTSSFSLQGERKGGIDDFTGTYQAEYDDFSGTEYLFGGTFVEREAGKDVFVQCNLENTSGTAQLFWTYGNHEVETLLEVSGRYSETLTLPEGGVYFGVIGEGFRGTIDLCIE